MPAGEPTSIVPDLLGDEDAEFKKDKDDDVTYHVYGETEAEPPQTAFKNFQTLVEVSARVAEGVDRRGDPVHQIAWEQENVRHVQDALNSQPAALTATNITQACAEGRGAEMLRSLGGSAVMVNENGAVIRQLVADGGTVRQLINGYPVRQVREDGTEIGLEDLLENPESLDLSTTAGGVAKPTVLQYRAIKTPPSAGKKRRRRSDSDGESGNRTCAVCGAPAGRHSYYGGQVCPSCRAFFRRSVTSGANKTYFCVKNGDCDVNSKTRKQCQFCRYHKCEDAGMKASWVITDNDPKKSGGKNEKSKRNSTEGVDDPSPEPPRAQDPLTGYITETELALINELVDISDFWVTSKVNDMDTALIREIIRLIAFGAKLSEPGLSQLASTMKKRSIEFALRVREMQQLGEEDRHEILSKNIPILIKLKISTFFNPSMTWSKQLETLLGVEEVEKLDKKLRSLQVQGLDNLRLQYSQFFSSPFLQTEDSEQQFCKLLNKIGSWPEDEKEYILICLLLLFSPDLLDLNDRVRVEKIQLSLAELLHNYLNHRHGRDRGRSKYASAMFLISQCRHLHDILTQNKIDFTC